MKPEELLMMVDKRTNFGMSASVRAMAPGSDRVVTFIASTDGLDRHGTKVMPLGINTDNYNNNPIILFGHDGYGGFFSTPDPSNIIGKADALRKSERKLEVDIAFLDAETNPRADMIYRMVKAGAVSTVSIGFIPREIRTEDDGAGNQIPIIVRSELLEISVVPIPSNPEALAISRELAATVGTANLMADAKMIREVIVPELTNILKSDKNGFREELLKALGDTKAPPADDSNERGATSFANLPLTERDHQWDGGAARSRMAKAASSDGSGDKDKMDWAKYRKGFFWFDAANTEAFGSYKLPYADVVNGQLTAVWRGVTAAAQRLDGTDIPSEDKTKVQTNAGQYYDKARNQYEDDSIVAPWDETKAVSPSLEAELGTGSEADSIRAAFDETKTRLAIRHGLRS